jgi:hypothetical protein
MQIENMLGKSGIRQASLLGFEAEDIFYLPQFLPAEVTVRLIAAVDAGAT